MDHYELLGVAPDASKDVIRDAYRTRLDALSAADEGAKDEQRAANRAERARLNDAWNVLSDPSQRARYDESRAEVDDDVVTPDVVVAAPTPPPAGATRVVGGGPLSQRSRRPVIPLPAGTSLADTRPRVLGMVFDLTVIILLVFVCQIGGQRIIESQYPAETARIDAAREARVDASEALSEAEDARRAAERDLAGARGSAAKAEARAELADAKDAERAAERADERAADSLATAQEDLRGPGTMILVLSALIGLVYLVPSTAITGRTLGMRLRGTKVVRVDGSPATWGAAFVRFLIPVAITTALFYSLPGLLLGLGAVLFWLWDPNRQGLHDRLARTLVVAAPVSKRR
ncbi:MAG: RDD family protein [Actinomycetes bacterium]